MCDLSWNQETSHLFNYIGPEIMLTTTHYQGLIKPMFPRVASSINNIARYSKDDLEPPMVMALKASVYTPILLQPSEEESSSFMESHIYRVVDCMLQHPQAASRDFRGWTLYCLTLGSVPWEKS